MEVHRTEAEEKITAHIESILQFSDIQQYGMCYLILWENYKIGFHYGSINFINIVDTELDAEVSHFRNDQLTAKVIEKYKQLKEKKSSEGLEKLLSKIEH